MERVDDDVADLICASYWFGSVSLTLQYLLLTLGRLDFDHFEVLIFPKKFGFTLKFSSADFKMMPSFLFQVSQTSNPSVSYAHNALAALGMLSKCSIHLKTKEEHIYLLELAFGKTVYLGVNTDKLPDYLGPSWNLVVAVTDLFENFPLRQKFILRREGWESRMVLECLEVVQCLSLLHTRPSIRMSHRLLSAKAIVSLQLTANRTIISSFEKLFELRFSWYHSRVQVADIQVSLYVGAGMKSKSHKRIFIVNNSNCLFPMSVLSALGTREEFEINRFSVFMRIQCASQSVFSILPPENGIRTRLIVLLKTKWQQLIESSVSALNPWERESSLLCSSGGKFSTFLSPLKKAKQEVCATISSFKEDSLNVRAAPVMKVGSNPVSVREESYDKRNLCYQQVELSLKKDDYTSRFLSQIDSKFLVYSYETKQRTLLLLFDQHGAHERIRLERFLKNSKPVVEHVDVKHSISGEEYYLIHQAQGYLKYLGYELEIREAFIRIHAAPVLEGYAFTAKCEILSVCEEYRNGALLPNSESLPCLFRKKLISKACRGAIKFGDPVGRITALRIWEDLIDCDFPFECAHGRTTLAAYTVESKKRVNVYEEFSALPTPHCLIQMSMQLV